MKIKNFADGVKKLKGFVESKGTISMEFTENEAGASGKYVKLMASNGVAQATVLCVYEGDETGTYIVGSKLLETAETLSNFGDEFEITLDKSANALKISCGDGEVLQEVCKDTMSLKMESIKDAIHLTVKAKDFAEVVSYGGFAAGDASTFLEVYKGTIILLPCVENDTPCLRVVSACNAFLAGALTEVAVRDTATFTNAVKGERRTVVSAAALSALAKRLVSDEIDLFIGNKQVRVRDGLDVYLFSIVNGNVQEKVVGHVINKVREEYSCNLDGSALKKVLQVAALSGEKRVELCFSENLLTVSASKSRAALPTVGGPEEEKTLPYDVNVLKEVVSLMPSELRVYAPKGAAGLFLEGINCKTYTLPMREE